MKSFEVYSLCLCFIVLIALTLLFTVLITLLAKYKIRLIGHGAEDEKILKEYAVSIKRTDKKGGGWLSNVFYALFFGAFFLIFAFSVFAKTTEKNLIEGVPSLHVVRTSSMEEKYVGNKYLIENNLNDQISTFDLIVTHKLPDEFDLKLYDIVVYEVEDTLIVHRIVGIEEPNEKHPNERYFLLQGDNVDGADRFPVHYSQMKSIYRGEKIPFIGSFVLFMQTPAGWMCVLLVLLEMISMPVVERKFEKEKAKRLAVIQAQNQFAPAGSSVQTCTYDCNSCYYYYCCYHCQYNENSAVKQGK